MATLAGVVEWFLGTPPWLALAAVFLVPALEASALLGIVAPGETALLAGGVLASQERVSLAGVLVAGISGAIVGDTVGYWVGRRWGRRMLPHRRPRGRRQVERAERFLRDHPGWAITVGRFPPGFRTVVPLLAGMSRVPYRRFLFYNVLGGALWGGASVMAGYLAGANWRHAHKLMSGTGIALVLAIVLGYVLVRSLRRARVARARSAA